MAQKSGFFKTTGALIGATVFTMMLVSGGGLPLLGAALIGIIGGGAAGGIAGDIIDGIGNKLFGSALQGSYHRDPNIRKLQRESERDGKQSTNLDPREAETRFRLMETDQAKDDLQREWQEKIEAERAAVDKNVYSSSARG